MFIEIPASKLSIIQRSLVQGMGVNDAKYMISTKGGYEKQKTCPYYKRWSGMLERCYSDKYHAKKPTYKDCTVSDEWLLFSNFKNWMIKQEWKGKELDKDILIQGNKVYAPDRCLFVTADMNRLTSGNCASGATYKEGITWCPKINKFRSRLCVYGKRKHLGYFASELDAHSIYVKEKLLYIKSVAEKQTEPLRSALLDYKVS